MCAWARNGTPNTLSGTADACSITDLTAKKFNQFLFHKLNSGNANNVSYCNADTSSVYATRYSQNGGTDATLTSRANLETNFVNDEEFFVYYCCSISGEEKLFINFVVHHVAAGATTAPQRVEFASKYVPSPDADITEMDFTNTDTGDFAAGTQSSALGGDVTEEAILGNNVQSGSRFEATDTRKIYYGALPSPDIDENFDSTGLLTWTDSDSAKITVDSSTNERLNFTFVRDSSTDETYHNLGSALSDTAWVMDFDLTLSTVNQGGGTDGNLGYIGIFSATGQSTQDGMHLQIISRSDYTRFRATASNNTTMLSEAISEGTAFTTVTPSETTYYVRIVRDGNDCTVKFYSTADRTGTPTESQTETQSGITALQYISVRNLNFSAGNSTNNNLVGYIDNLKVYDGVTSTTDLVWTEEV